MSGYNRKPAIPLVRNIRSTSLTQTVLLPSSCSSIVKSIGSKVLGRWCCGQLNSIPPEIHGSCQSNKCRFDNLVVINEVPLLDLVKAMWTLPPSSGRIMIFRYRFQETGRDIVLSSLTSRIFSINRVRID